MLLRIANLRTKLLVATPDERAWLVDYLSYNERAFAGRTVQRCHLDRLSDTFPTGFLAKICESAKADGFDVQLVDLRVVPATLDPDADLAWLRDYQHAAVQAVLKHKRGILWLPTGAGKTEVMVALTRALPCRWLGLVGDKQLADDMASRFELRSPGVGAGRVLEGHWDIPPEAQFTAATFQSIAAALRRAQKDPADPLAARAKALLEGAQGLVVDECHTLPADSFYGVAMQTRNAYYRVGMSGTPLARGDRKSRMAIAALGNVIIRVRSQLLIDRGVLAKPTVRLATVSQASACPTWQGVYGECIVRSTTRNHALVEMVKRCTKPGFVFVKEVSHGKALTNLLMKHGVRAEFIWGDHSVDWRRSHIKRLEQGHFDVLVCSVVFQQGIDVPSLRSVVVGSGGKSVIATLQRLGRGMRVDKDAAGNMREGGDQFEVWDVLDKGNPWTERHAKARMGAYVSEGFVTMVEPPKPMTLSA